MGILVGKPSVCLVSRGLCAVVVIPCSAKRHFSVGRRNAPGVPFSTGRSRVVCHAGVICLYWMGYRPQGCIIEGLVGDFYAVFNFFQKNLGFFEKKPIII